MRNMEKHDLTYLVLNSILAAIRRDYKRKRQMQGARLETTLAIIQVRNDASLHWGGTGGSGK